MKNFKDSQEAEFQRMMRRTLCNCPDMTNGERAVTMAIMNHWFHHKSGPKNYIHPSRKSIAKKARVSVATVKRTLGMLRSACVITSIGRENGGWHNATRYKFNTINFLTLCGGDWVDEFMRGAVWEFPQNDPQDHPEMTRKVEGQNDPLLKGTLNPIQDCHEKPEGGDHE